MRCVVAIVLVGACSFSPSGGSKEIDAPAIVDVAIPDAGTCKESDIGVKTCNGDTALNECLAAGGEPVSTPCKWGCVPSGIAGDAHCAVFLPAGGAVVPDDLLPSAGLDTIVEPVGLSTTINTDDGSISNVRGPGQNIQNHVEFKIVGNVGVFRALGWKFSRSVSVRGSRALAIVAIDSIEVRNSIDLNAQCDGMMPLPGGFKGGDARAAGSSPVTPAGAGTGNDQNCTGGGGGSHATLGGNSDDRVAGAVFGDAAIGVLQGGGGGGGGGGNGNAAGRGGHGGGAIQLVAGGAIAFSANGAIDAGGCGGRGGDNHCGGGGGAGGTILIEGYMLSLPAGSILAANGGGGGGGGDDGGGGGGFGGGGGGGDSGEAGDDASATTDAASGGKGGGDRGGDGGKGANSGTTTGGAAEADKATPGGGGGGLGFIHLAKSKLGAFSLLGTTTPNQPMAYTTGDVNVR